METETVEKKKIKVQPKLRFQQFKDNWSQRKLGNGIKLISGQHLSPGEYNSSKEGIPYFTGPSDFTDNLESVQKWTSLSTHFGNKNDILLTVKGNGVGTMLLLKLEIVAMGRQLMSIKTEDYDSGFVYQHLLTKLHLFIALASGNLIPGLSRPDILSLKIKSPSLPEQQKIATFLSAVDKKIQQLTRKKELLETYKKGVMQQLFSQEIRFKGEDGKDFPEWENKTLKDLLISYRLGGNYTNTEAFTAYPLIKMGNLGRGKINLNKVEYILIEENLDQKDKLEYGDLLFNTRNTLELVGKVSIWQNELPVAYYNSNLMYLKFENNFFMNYRMNSYEGIKALKRFATGTTSVAAIYTKDLLKVKLQIPSLKEQKKIAEFLSAIDKKIEAVSQQIEKTQNFKKGLLQQMFV